MTHDELERAVRRLVDKDEITDLVHRYSYCVDHRLAEETVALFTDDCVVDYGPALGPPLVGIAALREMFGLGDRPVAAAAEADPLVTTSHHNANVLITFGGGDRATVHTSLYAWHRFAEDHHPQLWGCYHDVVVRTPNGWRFSSRQLRIAGNEAWDAPWLPVNVDEPR